MRVAVFLSLVDFHRPVRPPSARDTRDARSIIPTEPPTLALICISTTRAPATLSRVTFLAVLYPIMSILTDTRCHNGPIFSDAPVHELASVDATNTSWSSAYTGIVRSISIVSINIADILGAESVEDLLTVTLPLSNSTESNKSLAQQIPPFVAQSPLEKHIHYFEENIPFSPELKESQIIPTVPTIPRLKYTPQRPSGISEWLVRI